MKKEKIQFFIESFIFLVIIILLLFSIQKNYHFSVKFTLLFILFAFMYIMSSLKNRQKWFADQYNLPKWVNSFILMIIFSINLLVQDGHLPKNFMFIYIPIIICYCIFVYFKNF